MPAVHLCSVFSTASPLGKCLRKVLPFPIEAQDLGASVQLSHTYRTHGDSGLHSYNVIILMGMVITKKRVEIKVLLFYDIFLSDDS